ncbi:MAG: pyridoxal-phosphate dependent enzyme [Acidimicrobiia bacterium]|nr:pyridoxal-phosphate dependent enzyme [Acidimicrobiia bacterium]
MNLDNPFIRYRHLLGSYRNAIERGTSDGEFVDLVQRLDDAVAKVEGHGFAITPFEASAELGAQLGLATDLWVKDDTGNVGQSHKARHLFGLALHLEVDQVGDDVPLAIASCGNAALAAGVVANAVGRGLDVFVPTWADAEILDRLAGLGARVHPSERRASEEGDPAYLRFKEAVGAGAYPFSVQGTDAPQTLDGGKTMGWEIGEQLSQASAELDQVFIQVGGGALASSTMAGIADARDEGWIDQVPALFPVQAEACAPLARAWRELVADTAGLSHDEILDRARAGGYMRPWDEPHSAATGILDDITYDWLTIVDALLRFGGEPVVASEESIVKAHELARSTGATVSPTGSAGLAGLLTHLADGAASSGTDRIAVLFTGQN